LVFPPRPGHKLYRRPARRESPKFTLSARAGATLQIPAPADPGVARRPAVPDGYDRVGQIDDPVPRREEGVFRGRGVRERSTSAAAPIRRAPGG